MIQNIKGKGKQGTCEVCDTQTEVFDMHNGKMVMCADCRDRENEVIQQSKTADAVIQQMRVVNTTTELKADLFNATAIAIVELKAAIWADESIADNKKQYAYTVACTEHFEHEQKLVFEERAALLARENSQRAWQIAAQTAAGQLSITEKEHFKKLNVSYQPTVKTIKPAKTKAPSTRTYKGSEYRDAATKYNVPVEGVRMIAIQRKLSADDAARIFAEQMAKAKTN